MSTPLRHGVPRGGDDRVGLQGLLRRRQAEMPLAHGEAFVAADGAEHGNVGVALERLDELRRLTLRPDLVEDDSGDPRFRVELRVAADQRRDAARHAEGVDDEHDRRAQQLGERRAGIAALQIDAVVQAFVALDDRDVARRATRERRSTESRRFVCILKSRL